MWVNVGVEVVVVRAAGSRRGGAGCRGTAARHRGAVASRCCVLGRDGLSRLAGSRRAVAAGRVAVPLPRCAPAAHGCDGASALCWPCGLLVGVLLLRWVLWCAGRSRHWGSSARPLS